MAGKDGERRHRPLPRRLRPPKIASKGIPLEGLRAFRVPPALRRQLNHGTTEAPPLVAQRLVQFTSLTPRDVAQMIVSAERKTLFWLDVQMLNRLLWRTYHAHYRSKEFRQLKRVQRLLKRIRAVHFEQWTRRIVGAFFTGAAAKNFKGAPPPVTALPPLELLAAFAARLNAMAALLDALRDALLVAFVVQRRQMRQTLFMANSVLFMAILSRLHVMAQRWRGEIEQFACRVWQLGDIVYGSARTVDGSCERGDRVFCVKKAAWRQFLSLERLCGRSGNVADSSHPAAEPAEPVDTRKRKRIVLAADSSVASASVGAISPGVSPGPLRGSSAAESASSAAVLERKVVKATTSNAPPVPNPPAATTRKPKSDPQPKVLPKPLPQPKVLPKPDPQPKVLPNAAKVLPKPAKVKLVTAAKDAPEPASREKTAPKVKRRKRETGSPRMEPNDEIDDIFNI